MKKRYLSGTTATGDLHLGNYLGALKNWVRFSNETDAEFLFFVADLHAITLPHDKEQLADKVREITAAYIACGLDTEKVIMFPHSAVPEHTYLQWLLGSVTSMGWLNRMVHFKEKAGKKRDNASLCLFAYPVLMAADILLYNATHVPTGEDQKQHVELARDIAGAFNHLYGNGKDFFTLPEPVIMSGGARIMSLRDATSKMSKSAESDMSRINLRDDADTIAKKIRKAKTDPEPVPDSIEAMKNRPEAANLISIYANLADKEMQEVCNEFGGKNFSEFKIALADLMIEEIVPISLKMGELLNDKAEIDKILHTGSEKARQIATPMLEEAKNLMGFWS